MTDDPLEHASEELFVLIAEALDHGVSSIEDLGGPLIPFVIIDDGTQKVLTRLVVADSAAAVARGSALVREAPTSVSRYALTFDTYVSAGTERLDAIVVFASERSMAQAAAVAQCYRPLPGTHPAIERLGPVRHLVPAENYFLGKGSAA